MCNRVKGNCPFSPLHGIFSQQLLLVSSSGKKRRSSFCFPSAGWQIPSHTTECSQCSTDAAACCSVARDWIGQLNMEQDGNQNASITNFLHGANNVQIWPGKCKPTSHFDPDSCAVMKLISDLERNLQKMWKRNRGVQRRWKGEKKSRWAPAVGLKQMCALLIWDRKCPQAPPNCSSLLCHQYCSLRLSCFHLMR